MTKDINLGYFGDNQGEETSASVIDFNCRNCGNRYSDESIHLAVFLYGFFCLHKKDLTYIGITCPNCLTTILFKESQSPSVLLSWYSSDINFGDLTLNPDLNYFTSIYHSQKASQCWPDLHALGTSYFHTTLGENGPIHLEDQLNNYVATNGLDNHLCSFDPSGNHLPPVELFVLYIDEQHIEKLLVYEQEKNVQIIPRYRHRLNLFLSIEEFCAKYGINSVLERLMEPAKASFEELKHFAKSNNLDFEKLLSDNLEVLTPELMELLIQNESKSGDVDFTREADFMNILSADPGPWDFSSMNYDWIKAFWQTPYPFKDNEVPISLTNLKPFRKAITTTKSHRDMVAEIEPVFSKGYVQKYLSSQYRSFIREYSRIATRYAFSYADVWVLKERYLEKVYQCIQAKKATRPAFNHREACRQIVKEKWDKNPDITIADMVRCDEISLVRGNDKLYPEETLRKWIKDLCPNRKPGRRPKKKKN